MNLQKLKLHNFRNFEKSEFIFSNDINIINGLNGSGKTSILESVYLLATGRSFRTSNTSKLIKFNNENLAIYSEFSSSLNKGNSVNTSIGYQKSKKTGKQIKLDGKSISSISEIAKILPVSCLEGGYFRALLSEPQVRRQIFDWGVFHVKHSFYSEWRRYQSVLQQRNKLLKTRVGLSAIQTWDQLFAESSIIMAGLREEYINQLKPYFYEFLMSFKKIKEKVTIHVNHGLHSSDKAEIICKLKDNFNRDLERGFTSFGPHRADLVFRCEEGIARDILSRGQQKIVLIAFFLAQLKHMYSEINKKSIVLVDDLASELDSEALEVLYQHLGELDHQLFITAIGKNDFPSNIRSCNTINLD